MFCAYAYDGPLLTQESWTGRVLGSVSHTYDAAFRVSGEQVNGGSAVSYGYDASGLLTSVAGTGWTMGITRQPASGLLSRSEERRVGKECA